MSAAVVPFRADDLCLPLERVRFQLEALDPIRLPGYSGSAFRGLLGHSLRHSVCVTRAPNCDGCLLRQHCVYSTFFESPALPAQAGQRYSALPHPFVLEPPPAGQRVIPPGDPFSLGMTLIGPAAELLPYLIHALQRAGERGLGRENARFRLLGVEQETQSGSGQWPSVYDHQLGVLTAFRSQPPALGPAPSSVSLALITPLRLKQQGHYLGVQQLDARALLCTLARRVALLMEHYQPEAEAPDWGQLQPAIDQVQLERADLRWVDWTRYSSRQRTQMQLGGLLGTLQLSGSGLPALWPLIVLGQWLHLGKNTSFGLGHYRLISDQDQAD